MEAWARTHFRRRYNYTEEFDQLYGGIRRTYKHAHVNAHIHVSKIYLFIFFYISHFDTRLNDSTSLTHRSVNFVYGAVRVIFVNYPRYLPLIRPRIFKNWLNLNIYIYIFPYPFVRACVMCVGACGLWWYVCAFVFIIIYTRNRSREKYKVYDASRLSAKGHKRAISKDVYYIIFHLKYGFYLYIVEKRIDTEWYKFETILYDKILSSYNSFVR